MGSEKRCPVKRALKNIFCPWPSVHNFLLILTSIYLLSLVDLTASEWASWVQAVGSIAAILGAFALSNIQVRRQAESQLEGYQKKASAYYAVVKNAADHANVLKEMVFKQNDPVSFKLMWIHQYSQIIHASVLSLKLLPAHELGSYDLVIAHNGIMAGLEGIASKVNHFVAAETFQEQEGVMLFYELAGLLAAIDFNWERFHVASGR